MTLADRIVIMRDGHVVQVGAPLDIFECPANTFVGSFIGSPPMNMLDGVARTNSAGSMDVHLADGIVVPAPRRAVAHLLDGQKIVLGVRADDLTPVGHGTTNAGQSLTRLTRTVTISEPLGTESLLFTSIGGKEVVAKMHNPRPLREDEIMEFELVVDRLHVFDAATGENVLVEAGGKETIQ
jgi:multiple sugar transport system ATP-binding protein